MSDLAVTNNFSSGTPAVADDVDTNFNDIVTYVNANLIRKDGSVAFTGVPSGPATDATSDNQYVRKAQLDSRTPTSFLTTWTPALTQGGAAVTHTALAKAYTTIGALTIAQLYISITGSHAAGAIGFTLPVSSSQTAGVIGAGAFTHGGTQYIGTILLTSATTVVYNQGTAQGGAVGVANGDVFSAFIAYGTA